jgi:serine/threonine protein kinase
MDSERWKQVDNLAQSALELPAVERDGFLRQACAGDEALEREVRSLLASEQEAGSFLEGQAIELAAQDIASKQMPRAAGFLTGQIFSHYRILEEIGSGGMGVVYKAEDIRLHRLVALKFLAEEIAQDPRALSRFEREARAASALNHPNICTIYDVEEHNREPVIVMELLEGETLKQKIRQGPIPVDEFLELGIQACAALEAAHAKGIIHRDIKSANIFVTQGGRAKILDFGLAKKAAPVSGHRTGAGQTEEPTFTMEEQLTSAGNAVGTVSYMSPEQVRAKTLDARTDLFSFGVVLYEMATCRQPFRGESSGIILDGILNRQPVSAVRLNPDLPVELERIIDKCLEKDRTLRYQHASEIRTDLQRLKRNLDSTPAASAATPSSPRRLPFGRAVALAVVLIAAAGWWFARPRQPSMPRLEMRQLTTNATENPVDTAAISPDGKYLAYSDFQGMHIRSIDSGETRTVPQPEGLHGERCCGVDAWFPDSTRFVVYSGDPGPVFGIWAVSVVGGAPHPLLEDGDPWDVSPDGSTIAFTRNAGRVDHREIWLMDADGRNARPFLQVDEASALQLVRWSPDGHRLAYARFHLVADRFEIALESRDLHGGAPVPVYQEIASTEAVARFRDYLWLADGRMILFLNETDTGGLSSLTTRRNLWTMQVNQRTGKPQQELTRLTDWPSGSSPEVANATHDGRITFRKVIGQSAVYIADLEAGGKQISGDPRRLTLEEGRNHPSAWTADNQAVIVESNRSGHFGIYRQVVGRDTAEAIVTGPENAWSPVVSPDGRWILYLVYPPVRGSDTPVQLMHVPVTGGPPQKVLETVMYGTPRCAAGPPGLCAIAEPASGRKRMVFTAFDPVAGRGAELTAMDIDPKAEYLWDLSPDGRRLAVVKMTGTYSSEELQVSEGPIHVLSLEGQPSFELVASGRKNRWQSLDWAADGKGLYVSADAPVGSVLLYLDTKGNTKDVWVHATIDRGTRGIPSRDGRRLAMLGRNQNSNVWLIEKF